MRRELRKKLKDIILSCLSWYSLQSDDQFGRLQLYDYGFNIFSQNNRGVFDPYHLIFLGAYESVVFRIVHIYLQRMNRCFDGLQEVLVFFIVYFNRRRRLVIEPNNEDVRKFRIKRCVGVDRGICDVNSISFATLNIPFSFIANKRERDFRRIAAEYLFAIELRDLLRFFVLFGQGRDVLIEFPFLLLFFRYITYTQSQDAGDDESHEYGNDYLYLSFSLPKKIRDVHCSLLCLVSGYYSRECETIKLNCLRENRQCSKRNLE